MNEWENGTKQLQEALNDPLLKVEHDPETGQFHVKKWMADDNTTPDPERQAGEWLTQMSCDHWDGEIEARMQAGRPSPGRWKKNRSEDNERVERNQRDYHERVADMSHEFAHDCYHRRHPRKYFIMG